MLWDLGYLRQALSEFRVSAEEVLRRVIAARGGDRRDELLRPLEQGQVTRAVERLHRGEQLLPARVAFHLLTLLAWGNYASHAQRRGHQATTADLAILLSLSVELEEWLSSEVEGKGSIFDAEDQALRRRQLEEQSTEHGLDAEVAAAFLGAAGPGASATDCRLLAPGLGLELFWRRPPPRPAAEPYRGLLAFEPEDALQLHGRAVPLERLEQNVDTRRLTILSGASGAGKTSLLRAGLLPSLLELGCGVLLLRDYGPRALAALRPVIGVWPERRPLVIVLDQLERLLVSGTPALQEDLLALVRELDQAGPGLRLVLSLREEHLGRLLREAAAAGGAELLLESDALVALGPLDAAGAREAAERPLQGTGLRLEAELLDGELLPDLLQAGGTLPCNLQLVCGRQSGVPG